MNCEDVRDLLHAYADNELDAVTAREVEGHLRDCADCQKAFAADRAVKTVIASPAMLHPAPNLLRERLLAASEIRAISRPKESGWFWRAWPIMNLAASLLIVAGLAWVYSGIATHPTAGSGDAEDVLAAHLRSMQIDSHLMDVKSTDQHTVKPWFDGKLDFAPPVRNLQGQGFPLIGGRLDYLHDRPVAALVYGRFKHLINVFIWPGESGDGKSELNGYNLVHWSENGMSFWAVSDVNAQDLSDFADLLKTPPAATKP